MNSVPVCNINLKWNIATKLSKAFLYDATQKFVCSFQVHMYGQMERQTERQVQKQSTTNMHCTANIHTAVHNDKLPVTQQFLTFHRLPHIG